MVGNQSTRHRFEMQLDDDELGLLDSLRDKLRSRVQTKTGVKAAVSRRAAIVEALAALDRELGEKERKR